MEKYEDSAQLSLTFVDFDDSHFEAYQTWFDDPDLERNLGPAPEQDWLLHVKTDVAGRQYAVFCESVMVAVVGIVFPTKVHNYFVISDLAVSPRLRRKGFGARVLEELVAREEPGSWRTYVDRQNPHAKSFFERNGWVAASEAPDQDGMYELTRVG